MEIKKYSQPAINQNISTEQKQTSSASTSQAKMVNADVKDQFERAKEDPLQSLLSNPSKNSVTSRNQTLNEAKQKFTDFLTSPSQSEMGDLFTVMMAYQKMMNKEAGEDRKTQRMSNQAELSMKEGKFELEKQKIEQMKTEAAERFDHAMDAANAEMVIGIASGGAATASATGGLQDLKETATQIKDEVLAKSEDEDEKNTVNVRFQAFMSWLNDKDD